MKYQVSLTVEIGSKLDETHDYNVESAIRDALGMYEGNDIEFIDVMKARTAETR